VSRLGARVSAAIANPFAVAQLTVFTPGVDGGLSGALPFTHPCTPQTVTFGQEVTGAINPLQCVIGARYGKHIQLSQQLGTVAEYQVLIRPLVDLDLNVGGGGSFLVSQNSNAGVDLNAVIFPPPSGFPVLDVSVFGRTSTTDGSFTFKVTEVNANVTCADPALRAWITPGAQAAQSLAAGDCVSNGLLVDSFWAELPANQPWTFDLSSAQFDSFLTIQDGAGNLLAQDDNSGGGTNARITITRAVRTLLRINALAKAAGQSGNYQLSMHQ
jgi:hypothetical protein